MAATSQAPYLPRRPASTRSNAPFVRTLAATALALLLCSCCCAPRVAVAQSGPTPDIVVALDGSGNYRSLQAAIDAAAPGTSTKWTVIYVKSGKYLETITVPRRLQYVLFKGDKGGTVVSAAHWAGELIKPGQPWVWNAGIATMTVLADDVSMIDMTIENTHGPGPRGSRVDQAVALQVNATRFQAYSLTILGFQDTLYTATGLQYYKNCDIHGRIDFAFGFAKAFFQDCNMFIRPWGGGVFAQGRRAATEDQGFVMKGGSIRNEAIAGMEPIKPGVIGRSWGSFSITVLHSVYIEDKVLDPKRIWDVVKGFTLSKAVYAEFNTSGPGATSKDRKKRSQLLTAAQAARYSTTDWMSTPPPTWIKHPSLYNQPVSRSRGIRSHLHTV